MIRLSLQQAVETALRNDTSLAAAQQRVRSATARVTLAQSAQRPQVSAQAGYTRGGTEGPSRLGALTGSFEDRQVLLRFRENLFDSLQTTTRVRQARADETGSLVGVEATRQRVSLEATLAYYGVLRAVSLAQVAQAALDRTRQEQQRLQSLVEVGEAARKEIPRARAEVAAAEVDAIAAENAVEDAFSVLRNVLGLPQDTKIELTDTFTSTEPLPDLADLIQEACRRRPDLRQAELQVEAARQALKLAEIQRGVTFSADAAYDVRVHPNPLGRSWSLGLSASYPLFDAGASKARVEEARAAVVAAEASLEQLRRDIALQVKQAYIQAEEARARLQAADRGVEAARESLAAAQGSLEAQVGIFLEVVAAQVGLTQAESRRVQALYDYNVAKARLMYAVGQMG
ncbi:MAG: TolC family protein [Armatimonadota bacterium]